MFDWIKTHWAEIGVVILALVRLAESIAAMTPTDKDDKLIAKVKTILQNFFTFKAAK